MYITAVQYYAVYGKWLSPHAQNVEQPCPPHIVAPNPSFVFFMMAVSGASKPPERPMRSPSDQPMEASILKPMFEPSIFAAPYNAP